jgi:VWFA-related protein
MRVVRAVLLLASLTFLGQPIPAQNSSQPEPVTTIRATAGEVLLDMVVRDKHHKPVTDLRAEEVEVYEDGVRQDVKHFRLVGGAEELQSERESVQTASASDKNGSTLLQPQQRLKQPNFVSVVLAPIAPLNREFAREAVLDFLKSDSLPNTFVTVYTASHGLTLVQPYTADKTILTAAVDKVARGTSGGGGPTGGHHAQQHRICLSGYFPNTKRHRSDDAAILGCYRDQPALGPEFGSNRRLHQPRLCNRSAGVAFPGHPL